MSWAVADDSPYGLHNLPYGSFTTADDDRRRVGVRVGERVLDVTALLDLVHPGDATFADGTLNRFLAAGPDVWAGSRRNLQSLLGTEGPEGVHRTMAEPLLLPLQEVRLHLPFTVADYVDFYSSEHHARNVGRLFRPGQDELTPNWKHLPIGYTGRAGTVVVSDTPVARPWGQQRNPDGNIGFGPSTRLDIEAEIGFVVGTPSTLGQPVPLANFDRHVFGICLVNDWSARDIQAWEYVPLGPHLGKSFATSVSPWVVPLAALQSARVKPPARDPRPLPYLDDTGLDAETDSWGLDLRLEVRLNGHLIATPPFREMYWTPAQQLAHLTSNGASVRTGDLYASGTVSGPTRGERGSLLELSWGGQEPLTLPDGTTRTFLEDGDEVVLSATAPGEDGRQVGLGEVCGRISPAHDAI